MAIEHWIRGSALRTTTPDGSQVVSMRTGKIIETRHYLVVDLPALAPDGSAAPPLPPPPPIPVGATVDGWTKVDANSDGGRYAEWIARFRDPLAPLRSVFAAIEGKEEQVIAALNAAPSEQSRARR